MIIVASILVGLLMAWLMFRVFFNDLNDFVESIGLSLTPEIISACQGEWGESKWASGKLLLYFGICIGSVFGTFYGLHELLG
jgi:hypothetical protein